MNTQPFDGLPGLAVAHALPKLLDQAGVALAAMDGDGRLSMLSPSLVAMLGKPFAPLPAADLPERYHLYDEHGLSRLTAEELPLVRARDGETVVDAFIVVKAPGQPPRHLRANAVPIPATSGDHRGALAIVEDVTQARAGTTTFSQLRTHLVQALNHELRTPVTTILGHAELLDDDLEALPSAAGSLDAVRRAGRRLEAVADDVAGLAEAATR